MKQKKEANPLNWDYMLKEEAISHYLATVEVIKDDHLTKEIKAIMTGTGACGQKETLLFNAHRCLGKTTRTPLQLLSEFLLKDQGFSQVTWRKSLNFFFKKRPQLSAYVSPTLCFSRVTTAIWLNLDGIFKYQASKVEGHKTNRTIIYFSFGGSLELMKGIKSIRNTLWTDTREFWTIQHSHLLGAKPLLEAEGFANPTNAFMIGKLTGDKWATLSISPKDFGTAMEIFTDLVLLHNEHILREADYGLLAPRKRQLLEDILSWIGGDENGKLQ